MTYVAPSDVRSVVAPDGSNVGSAAELGDDQLTVHIQRAQNLVDAYTGVAFQDSNVPQVLRDCTMSLAAFYATLAYRKGKELLPGHPVILQYQDAQKILAGIKSGILKFEPDTPDVDAPPHRAHPKVNQMSGYRDAEMFRLKEFGMRLNESDDGGNAYDVDFSQMTDAGAG